MPDILDYSPNVKVETEGNFVGTGDPKLHNLNNINNIALEDLIAIKLELSTRYLYGKFFFSRESLLLNLLCNIYFIERYILV